ncbi:MAG: hypothetical protein MK033_04050 [Candidatus Caenarcaniphilales bacterium]|nr:hypothetical protein [Candidatus Caenarcaniphilales bacterium]
MLRNFSLLLCLIGISGFSLSLIAKSNLSIDDINYQNSESHIATNLKVKKSFRYSTHSKDEFKVFYNTVHELEASSYKEAYLLALAIVAAKFEFNPINKIRHFQKEKNNLEILIAENPNNLELRYIRLAIQLNTPKVMSYKDNIEEDSEYIINELRSNPQIPQIIKDYFVHFLTRHDINFT